jgi:predicted nuclease with TOPRIM domain
MLKHEALVSNEQINSQSQQIIQLQNDLENAFQKAKNEKNLKELALKENHELKEQIFAMTADVDVLEERPKILQEENGKLEELVNDLKFNINQLQEEMKEKQHLAEQRIWQLEQALQQRTEEPSESPQEQVKIIESDVHPHDQNQSHLPLIDICENDNKVDYDSGKILRQYNPLYNLYPPLRFFGK